MHIYLSLVDKHIYYGYYMQRFCGGFDPLIHQVVDYYALDKPNKYIKDQVIRRRRWLDGFAGGACGGAGGPVCVV